MPSSRWVMEERTKMGTWGAAAFENDDASDWVYELEEAEDTAFLTETLESVTGLDREDYLELPEAARAIAAAEVVAALAGAPASNLPPEVQAWVGAHPRKHSAALTRLALRAIGRVKTNSELRDLWEEGTERNLDVAHEWYGALADLESRLQRS